MDSKPEDIARLLNEYTPGFLPEPLFVSIARLVVLSAVEFIPLRTKPNGEIEVLLFKRPSTDPVWPNKLHSPGTMLRPIDKSLFDAFDRLFSDELRLSDPVNPIFVGTYLTHHKRGSIATFEYVIPITKEVSEGKFYSINKLPENFITEQKEMVLRAAEKYKEL
jgi:hypothetical protein